jgi:hypothetical protein
MGKAPPLRHWNRVSGRTFLESLKKPPSPAFTIILLYSYLTIRIKTYKVQTYL